MILSVIAYSQASQYLSTLRQGGSGVEATSQRQLTHLDRVFKQVIIDFN